MAKVRTSKAELREKVTDVCMKARDIARKHRNDKNKMREVEGVLLKLKGRLSRVGGWAVTQGNMDLINKAIRDVQKISTKGVLSDHIDAFVKYYSSCRGGTQKFDKFKMRWDSDSRNLIKGASVPAAEEANIDKGKKWVEDNILQAWDDYESYYRKNIRGYFDPATGNVDVVKIENEILKSYMKRRVFDMFYKKMVKLRDALKTNIQDIDGFRQIRDTQAGSVIRVGWAGLEDNPQKGRIEVAYKELQEDIKSGSLNDMMEEMDEIAVV